MHFIGADDFGDGATMTAARWRVGSKVPVNVYDGDRPVCQAHNEQDARLIAAAPELLEALEAAEQFLVTVNLTDHLVALHQKIWSAIAKAKGTATPGPTDFQNRCEADDPCAYDNTCRVHRLKADLKRSEESRAELLEALDRLLEITPVMGLSVHHPANRARAILNEAKGTATGNDPSKGTVSEDAESPSK
jgi:hypothetical protein